jgi:hypothetical protein
VNDLLEKGEKQVKMRNCPALEALDQVALA